MQNEPKTVYIQTPVPGTYNKVSIRRSILKEAIMNGQQLDIWIGDPKYGQHALVDPRDWIRTGTMERRPGKYKTPLELYYNFVPIPGLLKKMKDISQDQIQLL